LKSSNKSQTFNSDWLEFGLRRAK